MFLLFTICFFLISFSIIIHPYIYNYTIENINEKNFDAEKSKKFNLLQLKYHTYSDLDESNEKILYLNSTEKLTLKYQAYIIYINLIDTYEMIWEKNSAI